MIEKQKEIEGKGEVEVEVEDEKKNYYLRQSSPKDEAQKYFYKLK